MNVSKWNANRSTVLNSYQQYILCNQSVILIVLSEVIQ